MEVLQRRIRVLVLAASAGCAGVASAGIETFDSFTRGLDAMAGGSGDAKGYGNNRYSPGDRGGGSSVSNNDTAGVQLLMYGSNGTVHSINSVGLVSVRRGGIPVSIGQNRNGEVIGGSRGTIVAAWDEYVSPTFNTIVLTIASSDGQDIMPLNVFNPSDPTETFDFWTWNFGVGDPVTWRNQMPSAPFYSANYKLSSDGGQTFFSTKAITNLSDPWDGVDHGTTQSEPGSGVNFLMVSYKVGQVPAPGIVAFAGLCTLGAARRRRR